MYKKQPFFRKQPLRGIQEVKYQACNFTKKCTPLRAFLRILVPFFRPVFCRTSHNLIRNKFTILTYIKATEILKVEQTFRCVT